MKSATLPQENVSALLSSLKSKKPVTGSTHNFYRYPARMSPEFAREAIGCLSQSDDVVLDPFLGGGTTIVEALANGRRAVGVDLNPLATFVTACKTTPMSDRDGSALIDWAETAPTLQVAPGDMQSSIYEPRVRNLPHSLVIIFERLLRHVQELPYPRQRRFARCALLRLGQWAVDCKVGLPEPHRLHDQLRRIIKDMLNGLNILVKSSVLSGVEKRYITGRRSILLRSTIGIEDEMDLDTIGRPRLVLTSPPYPGVHVLYHRWQVEGRRETPTPYWLIGAPDGHGASHFTMGGRSQFGIDNYFRSLTSAFQSVRSIIDPNGLVVQLVSFSDVEAQLSTYLKSMEDAGFREDAASSENRANWWRTVPNRNWYCRVDAAQNFAQELLLIHRPAI